MALGVGPGDEVITPTFSFFATAGLRRAARRAGRCSSTSTRPPTTSTSSAVRARDHAADQGDHAGAPVRAGRRHDARWPRPAPGMPIIEDAAQAIGARDGGRARRRASAWSAASRSSHARTSARSATPALVTTNDEALAARVRLLRDHGAEPQYHHAVVGGNFRLDALQAAVLRVKLPHLDAWTEARRRNAARYRAAVRGGRACSTRCTLPVERGDGSYHIYNQFVVRGARARRGAPQLAARGIGTEIYYPVPFHQQACFADLGLRGRRLPAWPSEPRLGCWRCRCTPSCRRRIRSGSSRRSARSTGAR